MITKSVAVSAYCNYLREVPQNSIASNFAQYAIALKHFRTKRHRANTASQNASLRKNPVYLYASYAAITLLHYLPPRKRLCETSTYLNNNRQTPSYAYKLNHLYLFEY